MGTSFVVIKFPDNEYWFTGYQNTSDVLYQDITKNYSEWHYPNQSKSNVCDCPEDKKEDCSIFISYGNEYVKGKACRIHNRLFPEEVPFTGGPYDYNGPDYIKYNDNWINDFYIWEKENI